jgi:hypothetical protein
MADYILAYLVFGCLAALAMFVASIESSDNYSMPECFAAGLLWPFTVIVVVSLGFLRLWNRATKGAPNA